MQHICECLHEAAQRLDKAKLDKLKAWVWEFGMQMACFLVQVGLALPQYGTALPAAMTAAQQRLLCWR